MGWIEAKKMCEATNSQLLSFQSPDEAENLVKFIQRTNPRRTRFEFWTGGNDIDKESNWVWSGQSPFKEPVADFGWLDRPFPSAEENCLTWSITITNIRRGTMSQGWHSDSCCNNIYFICELPWIYRHFSKHSNYISQVAILYLTSHKSYATYGKQLRKNKLNFSPKYTV